MKIKFIIVKLFDYFFIQETQKKSLKSFVVVRFNCDKKYDLVHSSWINDEQTATMYPTELNGKSMVEVVDLAVSISDTSYKFKSYACEIIASGSKYILIWKVPMIFKYRK